MTTGTQEQQMTFEQALQALYNGTRQLNVGAEVHEMFGKCAERLATLHLEATNDGNSDSGDS